MRRSLAGSALALTLAVGAACALVASWPGNDAAAIRETVLIAAPVGVLWLAAGHLAVGRSRLGPFRLHYAAAAAGTALVALAAVLWMARQMFVEEHDAAVLGAFVAFAAVIGVRTAALLAGRMSRDVDELRHGLDAIAAGDLSRRVAPGGADELAALAGSANQMAERLARAREEVDAADAARRNLVAAVSHDLRTPLASLRLLVEALEDGVVHEPEEVARSVHRMRAHVDSLSALVDDLFELARIDAGDITWSLSRVAVGELIGETLEAFRPEADQKGLRLIDGVDARPIAPVLGNPERLQRVLHNLVQNAVRHTPADGTVVLRAAPEDRFVRIEVADDGDGMPPDVAERAFERFFRGADAAARPSGGAGLGLSICRAIVEAHGGRIWVEPAQPRGVRVVFTVPAA